MTAASWIERGPLPSRPASRGLRALVSALGQYPTVLPGKMPVPSASGLRKCRRRESQLNLASKQYRRWGPLRFIWWPYMTVLSHRSRLSHGIMLSTVVRIFYFLAVVALLATLGLYLRQRFLYGVETTWGVEFRQVGRGMGEFWRRTDKEYFWAAFAGLWLGAAAHTVADLVVTIAKKLWQAV